MTGSATGTALGRDRTGLITGGLLLVVAAAAWLALLTQAEMPMAGADLAEAAAFFGAWTVMMAAMMLPSAIPMLALYAVLRRNAARGGQRPTAGRGRQARRITYCQNIKLPKLSFLARV